jgi:hypothetical protein
MRLHLVIVLLVTTTFSPTAAQSRWKEIGKTSAGNSVYVDPRSVKKNNGIITARIRVRFTTPVKQQNGDQWDASHHIAMFDCAKSRVAAKETIYYSNEAAGKIASRSTNAIPGFGPAIGGSMTQVALDYFCKK